MAVVRLSNPIRLWRWGHSDLHAQIVHSEAVVLIDMNASPIFLLSVFREGGIVSLSIVASQSTVPFVGLSLMGPNFAAGPVGFSILNNMFSGTLA